MEVVSDFKKFVNKGNIFSMAVGVVVGAAFTAMLNSLVNDIIMPLISRMINFDITSAKVILRQEVIDEATEEVLVTEIALRYGNFFQMVINFFIIAISIYIAIKVVKHIKNSYIKSQIKYIKKLKKQHPEFFDEEDELGTKLYEKMKKSYPQYFKGEEAEAIEEKKPDPTPEEIQLAILSSINENLSSIKNSLNPEPIKEEEINEETVDEVVTETVEV